MTMIRVDGASLHHERRGSGPALLMISGGAGYVHAPEAFAVRLREVLAGLRQPA